MSPSRNDQFASFSPDDNGEKYYLRQEWPVDDVDSYLTLTLTDGTNYWIGNYLKQEVDVASNKAHFDSDGIKSQLLQAFKAANRSKFSIKLSHTEDFGRVNLVIKKLLESEVKLEVVSLTLRIVDDATKKTKETFDYAINKLEEYEAKTASMEERLKRLENEREEDMKTLNELICQKEEIESDLYSKFLAVLNEKKAKIRELS